MPTSLVQSLLKSLLGSYLGSRGGVFAGIVNSGLRIGKLRHLLAVGGMYTIMYIG